MKNLLMRILACMLVFTMVFAFASCTGNTADTGDDDTDIGADDDDDDLFGDDDDDLFGDDDDDLFGDDDDDEGNEGNEGDDDDDDESSIWDYVYNYTVPNSTASISYIDIADRVGTMTLDGGVVTSGSAQAIAEITNVELAEGSAFKIEYDYTGSSDSGLIFAANPEKDATTWEWEGIPYYFAFVDANGTARLAKVDPAAEAKWTNLAEKAAGANGSAHVIVEWDGAGAIKLTVGDTVVEATGDLANAGTKLAFRAGAEGVTFENVKITFTKNALDLSARFGDTWEIVTSGKHEGGIYTGYTGDSALGSKTLALIDNVDFANAKKITLAADVTITADWRTVNPDTGAKTGNQNYGFIFNVYNDDELMPLFWEGNTCSYFYVFFSGNDATVMQGKWGKTSMTDTNKAGDGWFSLPGILKDESGATVDGKYVPNGVTIDKPAYEKPEFNYGEYLTLTAVWDVENLTLTSYVNGVYTQSTTFTSNPFINNGNGVGVRTNSGDVYYNNFVLTVE